MEEKLIKIIYSKFKEENGFELPKDKNTFGRVVETSKKVLIELQNLERTEILLPFITATNNGPIHLNFSITKEELDSYNLIVTKQEKIIDEKIKLSENTASSISLQQNNPNKTIGIEKKNSDLNTFYENDSKSFFEKHINQKEKKEKKQLNKKALLFVFIGLLILGLILLGAFLPYLLLQ